MSEFDDLMGAGFAEVSSYAGSVITCKTVSCACVTTGFMDIRQVRETGFFMEAPGVVEVTRANFMLLGIVDRSIVTMRGMDGFKFRVDAIDNDPSDPCVRLHLKLNAPER